MTNRVLVLVLGTLLLTTPVDAHNGEYVAPESLRRPPPVTPREGQTPTTGTPSTTPDAMPKPKGVPTPGLLKGREKVASPDAVVREEPISWELVWELIRINEPEPPRAIPEETRARLMVALERALTDPNESVKSRAALALGRAGGFQVVAKAIRMDLSLNRGPALLSPGLALGDHPTAEDRKEVVESLDLVLANAEAPLDARVVAALCIGHAGPGAANVLLEALGTKPPEILRRACLFALGGSGHAGARDLLVAEILPPDEKSGRPDDPGLRALVVHALSRVPGHGVTGDLVRRLRDPSSRVRAAAALSLAERLSESAEARAALRDLALKGTPLPRSAALLALALGGDDRALAIARTAVKDPVARGTGLPALGALCVGYLRSASDGADLVSLAGSRESGRDLRCAAAVASGLVRARGEGKRLAGFIDKTKDPDIVGYLLIGVSLIEPERAVKAIERRWKSDDRPGARYLMAEALGYAGGGEKAAKLLIEALGDSYFVNREAAVSLFRFDPDRAAAEVLTRLGNEKNVFARRFATVVLGRVLDRRRPSYFAATLLGTGLDTSSPLPRFFLYLERELLFARSNR